MEPPIEKPDLKEVVSSKVKDGLENVTKKVGELKDTVTNNPVLSSHIDSSSGQSFTNIIPNFGSTDLADLEGLNEAAVQYYSQIIANEGFDQNSESYKAFKELLAILSVSDIRKKLLDKNKGKLASSLKYFIDQNLEKAEGKDLDEKINNRRIALCKAVSRLNAKIKNTSSGRSYKLQIYNNNIGKSVPDYCTKQLTDADKELFKEYSAADKISNKDITFVYNGKNVEFPEKKIGGNDCSSCAISNNKMKGGSNKYYKDALEKLYIAKETKDDDLIRTVIHDIENHPIYSPKFEELEISDRLIMILLTFIIRNITLFLINWGVDSSFITSFKQGLIYYIILYTFIFLLVVSIVNNKSSDNISIKLMFYYLNIESQGYIRIIAHLLILYSLMPIIFILKDKNVNTDNFVNLTYQDKIKIKDAIGMFTLSSWILTSIIVLRF